MESIRNTGDRYSQSYSYQRIERRKRIRNFIIWQRTMGSILVMLSFFIPVFMTDQDGNGSLMLIMWVVSVVLFTQTKIK